MPTVWEAATGQKAPACPSLEPWDVNFCAEGVSFLPLAADPMRPQWKRLVLSQWPGIDGMYPPDSSRGGRVTSMGYSIITHEGFRVRPASREHT